MKRTLDYVSKLQSQLAMVDANIQKIRSNIEDSKFIDCKSLLLDLYTSLEYCKTTNICLLNEYQARYMSKHEYTEAFFNKLVEPKIETEVLQNGYLMRIYEKAPLKNRKSTTIAKHNWHYYTSLAINKIRESGKIICYQKALVVINIHHPLEKYGDIFDMDNACIHPIINTIKGNFCKDDSRDFMELHLKSTIDQECYVEIIILDNGNTEVSEIPIFNNTLPNSNT